MSVGLSGTHFLKLILASLLMPNAAALAGGRCRVSGIVGIEIGCETHDNERYSSCFFPQHGYLLGWKGDFEPTFPSAAPKPILKAQAGDEKFEKRRRKKQLKVIANLLHALT